MVKQPAKFLISPFYGIFPVSGLVDPLKLTNRPSNTEIPCLPVVNKSCSMSWRNFSVPYCLEKQKKIEKILLLLNNNDQIFEAFYWTNRWKWKLFCFLLPRNTEIKTSKYSVVFVTSTFPIL